jgi:hypothetical protein
MENNLSKWYVHVLHMEVNRWPKRILGWLSERGVGGRRRPKMKWKSEVKGVMKRKNLTAEDAVNMQIWQKKKTEQH